MNMLCTSHYEALFEQTSYNPHDFLGLHEVEGGKEIRVYRPGATEVTILVRGKPCSMEQFDERGLFILSVDASIGPRDYKVYHNSGLLSFDPYTFLPTLGELDQHLFAKGCHYHLYEVMGGRLAIVDGIEGAKFNVWAPNARSVSLVADFNHFDGRVNPMRSLGSSGIFELFVPGLQAFEKYKFEIQTQDGRCLVKTDPYGLGQEVRPRNASVLQPKNHVFRDQEWMEKRKTQSLSRPINIYEVHLGSWKKGKDGQEFLSYAELAQELSDYCVSMGYTHVEVTPIAEHPLDESWGYQTTGFYAPTSRFGHVEDFQAFVDTLHQKGIGVILDWVGGHFPTDGHALTQFDGSFLYEHADPRQGFHPHWQTNIFNYGRSEVSNFLIANVLYWIDVFHIDGIRVDAVASMLYLDYGREEGEWIPNQYGGKENIEAIEVLRHMNSIVHEKFPGVLMIAEESTSFGGVSHSVEHGGLGFDFKWNMGWMNDTLRYIARDPIYRQYHQNDLTFSLLYAFSEKFVSVLSHDEVVHGKGSLISKIPGDFWQKFATLRLLISYMMCHPGKKLLFMGGEIAQWNEWNCKHEVEWGLLGYPTHQGIQDFCRAINHFYLNHESLWADDFSYGGFEWVSFSDTQNCVLAYLRKGGGQELLCVHNFTPSTVENYTLSIPGVTSAREELSSDETRFGGSGQTNADVRIVESGGQSFGIEFTLAPLSTQIFSLSRCTQAPQSMTNS